MLTPLFDEMIAKGASDLHWSDGDVPRLRLHGFLEPIEIPESLRKRSFESLTEELIGHWAYEQFRHNLEFDGAATVSGGRRIRINVYMKDEHPAWAIRLLPNKFMTFDELGLPVKFCQDVSELRQGLVLITGATGSGKTTTLASWLHYINQTRHEHIFTIEDPVEYVHKSECCLVSQREVGRDTKGFHEALKSVLREDPDIVLLGEMRDRESMDAALTLSETGHLTFATLHTSGAVESISRIISNFDAMEQDQVRERLAANLKVVVTQQLVPWSDGAGRSLCAEIMVSTKAIRAMIRDHKERQLFSLIETGSEYGMMTMNSSLERLVREHRITIKDALRCSPDKEALQRTLLD